MVVEWDGSDVGWGKVGEESVQGVAGRQVGSLEMLCEMEWEEDVEELLFVGIRRCVCWPVGVKIEVATYVDGGVGCEGGGK